MKYCKRCQKSKSLSNFYPDKYKKDGYKYQCISCHNEYNNKLRSKNPEIHRIANLEYARSFRGKELQRIHNLRRKFWPHLTAEQAASEYDKLLEKQNHCCAFCNKHKSEFKIALAVDHQRFPHKVRGLLCNRCNRFEIGRHTLQTAKKLVEYFNQYEEES